VGAGFIIPAMSRLRRLVLADRFFFISCRVLIDKGQWTRDKYAFRAVRYWNGTIPQSDTSEAGTV